MFSWNIRNQILLTGAISLVVLLSVVVYFYSFSKGEFTSNSNNLIKITNRQYADEITRVFENSSKTYQDWIKEDVFGIALEFNTTEELRLQFEKWLSDAPGFALLVLTDKQGVVIEAASQNSSIDARNLKNSRLPDYSVLKEQDKRYVQLLQSKLISENSQQKNFTYLFHCPAFDMSGKQNGIFIAYLDWRQVDGIVNQCTKDLASIGYDEVRTVLLYPGENTATSMASTDGVESSLNDDRIQTLCRLSSEDANKIMLEGQTFFTGTKRISAPAISAQQETKANNPLLTSVIPENVVMAQLNQQLTMIIIIGCLGTLIVLGISYIIARRISRRISSVAKIAAEMAKGNIDVSLDFEAKDETGDLAAAFKDLSVYLTEMAQGAKRIADQDLTIKIEPRSEADYLGNSFKTMVTNLTNMVQQLNDSAVQLVSSANEISVSSGELSKGAGEQADQINQISTAIEEMATTSVETSQNASEANDASKSAADTAENGGNIVDETIEKMRNISLVVRESAESIAKLAKSADQIGEIVSVIDEIADQTNLLALNAAIEAARAGEQGRGFAVVADEVRKLAERTGTATGEITEMIKGIQNETEEAVNSMETGVQEVDKGLELADKAGNSLQAIVKTSQQVTDMVQQIATAADEQSVAAEQVSKNIGHVSSITKESASSTEQSAISAERLNKEAEGLKGIVDQFKINT